VLLATAMMAIVAAACLPLIREASAAAHDASAAVGDLEPLASLADTYVLTFDGNDVAAPSAVPWPDDPARQPASIQRIDSSEPEADHAWLLFTDGDQQVLRWVPLPEDTERNE